jgi:hypothetical protein
MTGGHVRLEVSADLLLRWNPHGAVRGIRDPRTVTLERRLELGECARIGVDVFVVVAVDPDQDLAGLGGRLLPCLLLCRELGGRRRRRGDVPRLLRVLRLRLVCATSHG